MTNLIGQYLGRYQLIELLGQGGMATVYKAYDSRLGRDVAIKIILRSAFPPEMLDRILVRFDREARSMARLSHSNIVKVHDYGEYEGSPYLVLEYLPGGDLKERLDGKPVVWQEAVRLILPIARALQFAHKHGIIHRDIKPSNILFTTSDEPMLYDFGIAKILEGEDASALTGTPGYMAPEQWTGTTSPLSDEYGLGVVLYEMIAGRIPYISDTPAGLLVKQTTEPMPSLCKFVPDLPVAVEQVLLKALAKNPTDRYADMGAFVKALESILTIPAAQAGTDPYKIVDAIPIFRAQTISETPPIIAPFHISKGRMPERVERREVKTKPINWLPWAIGAGVLIFIALTIYAVTNLMPAMPVPIATPSATGKPTLTATLAHTNTPSSTFTPVMTWTPELGIGSTMVRDQDQSIMVYVPAGEFLMGSDPAMDKDSQDDEQPQHSEYLDAYWIDQTEVTNGMYALCVGARLCKLPGATRSSSRSSYYGDSEYNDYPVVNVDWHQAKAYCAWAGAELPTEAQWEKAARGADARIYPWGNNSPTCDLANYSNCIRDTTAVKSYESGKSPYGAYDMAGNVWEWVNDWYDSGYYNSSPTSNPSGPTNGDGRVLRGGAWYGGVNDFRSAHRGLSEPVNRDIVIGFRCALSTSTPVKISTPSATGKPTLTATLAHTNTPSSTFTPVMTWTPELGIGSTMVRDQDQSIMVYVPAGEFLMGSDPAMDKDSQDDEQPQHSEYLDAYWIDQTEVTNGMYALCVGAGMCDRPADISSSSRSSYYGDSEYNDYPVVKVDWNQAKAYCAWAGAELPTEAQWEKAARGEDARIYPWGNNSPTCDLANNSNCIGDTTAVKSYESGKSPYGAYDMAGNVWEWVNDWYDSGYYNSSPTSNPTGPTNGDGRVLRGGAWYGGVNYFRSAYRYRYVPGSGTAGIGFRCALSK